jgi:hypothetical protein
MAYKKYARECDECGAGMNEGYLIDNGYKYYCSDECLHKNMTPEEWLELYNDGDGDSCWTTWYEDPDEYMVDEDDPAPNKLSVELADAVDSTGKVDEEKVARLFAKQLQRGRLLDPNKYDFINWTITCDVQVKEEDKA